MFERLPHPEYWLRMVRANSVRWTKPSKPVGELLGWSVWTIDGKALLFRTGAKHCLRADWFEFCNGLRWLGLAGL